MTQNQLINQIVEVLNKHGQDMCGIPEFLLVGENNFKKAATEIASLHPHGNDGEVRVPNSEEIDEAAREYAHNMSNAPDKETPDWVVTDFKSGVRWALNYIKEPFPQENDGWISVEDRLPETDGLYYTFIKTKVSESMGETMFQDGEFMSSFVTHWQPLPSPPKSK